MTVSSVKTGELGLSFALNNNYMEPIATTLVGSGGTNNVTFNDIPQTYKHLQIRLIVRSTTGGVNQDELRLQINNDTSSSYARHILFANGSTVTSSGSANQSFIYCGGAVRDGVTASIYSIAVIDILDYTNTNKYTTVRSLNGDDQNGAGSLHFSSGLWMNTDAVTSVKFYPEANSFKQHSRFSLYGIKG